MMKQLFFEIRKIGLSKLTVAIILCLLLLSAGLAYRQAGQTPESGQSIRYERTIKSVITNAERQYQQSLYNSKNSYATLYFEDVIDVYTGIKELPIAKEKVNGWDTYLSFNAANPLHLICAVFVSVQLFGVDSKTGMLPIIYASAGGRMRYMTNKLLAMLLSSVTLTALFFGVTLAAMLPACEFAGLGEYVQSFRAFIVAPYAMRTWQAVLLLFCVRACMTVFVSAFVGLLTYALGNRLVSLLLAVLVYVANVLLDGRTYLNTDVFYDHCNLVAASDATTLFSKYQCVRVLGRPIPVVTATLVFYAALALICMGAIVLLHQRFVSIRLGSRERRARKGGAMARGGSVLLGWELKKILKNRFVVLTVALLLVASAASAVVHYKEYTSKSDQIYYDYVQVLAPMDDAQRWAYLDAEGERISQGYKNYFKYRNETPDTLPEGIDMIQVENEYYYACLHEYPFARVREACAYQSERGLDGLTLLYDTGWMTLFSSGDDILLFLAILMVATFSAAVEYSSKFAGILPTTVRGRRETGRAKLSLCLISTTVFFAVFSTMQIVPILLAYRFEDAGATLVSLQTYQNVAPNLTLWQYAVLMLVIRYVACMLTSVLAYYLTGVIKVSYLSMMLLTVIVQLPQLVYGMGVDALQYFRLTALLDGNELVLMLVDGGMIWAVLLMLVFLTLCAVFACINIRKNKEEA